jgi:hypothetical protein
LLLAPVAGAVTGAVLTTEGVTGAVPIFGAVIAAAIVRFALEH